MIVSVQVLDGNGKSVTLPVHHYVSKDECLYYRRHANMFIVPEIYPDLRDLDCDCYLIIQHQFRKIQAGIHPLEKTPLKLKELSAADIRILDIILYRVARVNMATRMNGSRPSHVHVDNIEVPFYQPIVSTAY